MSWAKIGFAPSKNSPEIYKKYEPPRDKRHSRQRRTLSMSRQKSFEKMRLSLELRDSSKLISLKCIDFLDHQRPSTPLSNSTTSLQIEPQVLQSPKQGLSTIKRIKNKLMVYTKDLKQEMVVLQKYLRNSRLEFISFKAVIDREVERLIESLNKQIREQKQELDNALRRINHLQSESKSSKKRTYSYRSVRNLSSFSIQKPAYRKEDLPEEVNLWMSVDVGDFGNGSRQKGGLDQMQITINRMKKIFVDPIEV